VIAAMVPSPVARLSMVTVPPCSEHDGANDGEAESSTVL